MTAEDTRPDLFPPIPPEPEAEDEGTREPRLRPLDRRILQAIALVCAVSALLSVQWMDERNNVEKNLKPPEKVITVAPGKVGELVGARWMLLKRENVQPLTGGAQQGAGEVTELRLTIGVRPETPAAAKEVGSFGMVYRLVDDQGREWQAMETTSKKPRAGVAMLLTVKATVPRAVADSLKLEIRAPRTSRKAGEPLPSLRFEH